MFFRRGQHISEADLSAYADGEVSGARERQVREHVADCAACRELLEGLRETKALVAGLPRAETARSFRLTPAMAGIKPQPPRPRALSFAPAVTLSVLVALLLIDLGSSAGVRTSRDEAAQTTAGASKAANEAPAGDSALGVQVSPAPSEASRESAASAAPPVPATGPVFTAPFATTPQAPAPQPRPSTAQAPSAAPPAAAPPVVATPAPQPQPSTAIAPPPPAPSPSGGGIGGAVIPPPATGAVTAPPPGVVATPAPLTARSTTEGAVQITPPVAAAPLTVPGVTAPVSGTPAPGGPQAFSAPSMAGSAPGVGTPQAALTAPQTSPQAALTAPQTGVATPVPPQAALTAPQTGPFSQPTPPAQSAVPTPPTLLVPVPPPPAPQTGAPQQPAPQPATATPPAQAVHPSAPSVPQASAPAPPTPQPAAQPPAVAPGAVAPVAPQPGVLPDAPPPVIVMTDRPSADEDGDGGGISLLRVLEILALGAFVASLVAFAWPRLLRRGP